MRLTMLGLPAAGKGTQGVLLAEEFGVPHLSTGSLFREAMKVDNAVGRLARLYIDQGQLVPDETAIEIVKERLGASDMARGYILDGYPRTLPQAKALETALAEMEQQLDAAVLIDISPEAAIVRIAQRRVCEDCGATYYKSYLVEQGTTTCEECDGNLVRRADDTEETARKRLQVYMRQTQPVVEFYDKMDRLITVDGEQNVEDVYRSVKQSLSAFSSSERIE